MRRTILIYNKAGFKFLPIILSFLFLSCSAPLNYYRREGEEISRIKKVAVLPFRNITDQREAGKIITNLFMQELFDSGFCQVEETGNIREFFIRQRIRKKGEMGLDTIRMLGAQFGLDAVILGMVEEFYQEEGGRGEISPLVSLSARMIGVKEGKILWKCHHQKKGDDYIFVLNLGRVSTVTTLARKVIREMIVTIKAEG